MLKKFPKFFVAGLISTGAAYCCFMALLHVGMRYEIAVVGSWAAALIVSFSINRKFTFGIVGSSDRKRDFFLFALGSLLQLGIAEICYGILVSRFGLHPTPAFIITLLPTTAFSFGFASLVVFRRKLGDRQ